MLEEGRDVYIHTGGGESGEKCKFIVSSGWLEDQCDGIFVVAMRAMSMALHHCMGACGKNIH